MNSSDREYSRHAPPCITNFTPTIITATQPLSESSWGQGTMLHEKRQKTQEELLQSLRFLAVTLLSASGASAALAIALPFQMVGRARGDLVGLVIMASVYLVTALFAAALFGISAYSEAVEKSGLKAARSINRGTLVFAVCMASVLSGLLWFGGEMIQHPDFLTKPVVAETKEPRS